MEPANAELVALAGWRELLEYVAPGVAYVHVPFCPAHCTFCGFSTTYGLRHDRVRNYLEALAAEAELLRQSLPLENLRVKALFTGGGTPNYLRSDEFVALVAALRTTLQWDASAEWTVEIYPSRELTANLLRCMRDLGVNRISLAAQDFNDDVLSLSRRHYSADEALEVGHRVRALGFVGMNVDLMVGIPGQSLYNAAPNLDAISELEPTHVTLNPFSNHSPTIPLRSATHRDKLTPVGRIYELYNFYRDWLIENSFRQVGKTNFERLGAPGFKYEALVRASTPRLGLGANALSFNGFATYRNFDRLGDYQERVRLGRLPIASAYRLCNGDEIRSAAFYRIINGALDLAEFRRLYAESAEEILLPIGEVLAEFGLAFKTDDELVLTDHGIWNLGIVQRAFLPLRVLRAIVNHQSPRSEEQP